MMTALMTKGTETIWPARAESRSYAASSSRTDSRLLHGTAAMS